MSTFEPVALITGASAGIGAAFARLLAARGHATVLVARREAELTTLADAIAASGHPRPQVLALDLGQPDSGDQLAAALAARGLEPSLVVNNAGFGLAGDAAALDRAAQLAMIDLNVRLLTDLSLRFVDSLARHRGGIINVASVAGFLPGPGMAVYFSGKAFVVSFSEALHAELAPKGIRVTALCPGPVPTEFQERAGLSTAPMSRLLTRSPERVARDGYDGWLAGKRLVVPGFANWVTTVLPRFLPRVMVLALVARYQREAKGEHTG
jgi:uncharacterized protein